MRASESVEFMLSCITSHHCPFIINITSSFNEWTIFIFRIFNVNYIYIFIWQQIK